VGKRTTLTSPQVAAMCGVTPRTVHRWVRAGYFPGARKGLGITSPYRIPQDEVEAFIAQMSEGLKEQWRNKQPQDKRRMQDTALPAGQLEHPEQRAVLAALAEMLHQFEGQQTRALFALIVEDDASAGDMFAFTLKAVGFNPIVVRYGTSALSLMASVIPDIVVLDLHLPDVPGAEILHHMRSDTRLADVPVIVAADHPRMAEDIQDEANGLTELAEVLVLIKPVRYDVLQDKAVELAHA
jgi:CheY-like chemotaxis protein/predicted DNA-binding transcriptional regulator AlpA